MRATAGLLLSLLLLGCGGSQPAPTPPSTPAPVVRAQRPPRSAGPPGPIEEVYAPRADAGVPGRSTP